MGETQADCQPLKSSQRSRPIVDGPRQVHFEAPPIPPKKPNIYPAKQAKVDVKKIESKDDTSPKYTQPSSFPAVGSAPGSAFPGGQWHTSPDPTRSLGSAQVFYHNFAPQGHGPLPCPQNITYIGAPCPPTDQPTWGTAMAADYANAAPPPTGTNFQPPVPDTTYGPMMHTFMPRFDGPGANMVPGTVPVGVPSFISPPVQFVPTPSHTNAVALRPNDGWFHRYSVPGPSGYYFHASWPEQKSMRLF